MADPSLQSWASSLLHRLGIHQTPGAVQALVGWAKAEGGHFANDARYNPLNTTQPEPGAGNTGTQGNIKVYKNWNQGLDATVKTLRNGRYGGILHALQTGDPNAVASAIDKSQWGTHGPLIYRAIGTTPQVQGAHPFDGSSSSSPSGGGSPSTRQVTTSRTIPGVDNSQARNALLLQFLQQRHNPQAVIALASGLGEVQDTPATKAYTTKTVQSSSGSPADSVGGSTAFASSRIGRYKETSGANRGPDLDVLENRFGMTGQPWCAIFATTAAAHSGASRAVRTASVAQINQWAAEGSHGYQQGLLSTSQARPGDLLTLGNAHVGVVEKRRSDGSLVTIEGNTSTGGVQRRVRQPGEGRIARPKYSSGR